MMTYRNLHITTAICLDQKGYTLSMEEVRFKKWQGVL